MLITSNSKTLSQLFAACGLGIALLFSGCAAPGTCGSVGCSDCDGLGNPEIIGGPLDGLRQLKRQMVCGSGCGETYYGEWRSTPPDACDPCERGEFVGGATPCQPFCWRPGMLLGNIYGVRFCDDCGESADACHCGGTSIVERAYASGTISQSSSQCGCGGHHTAANHTMPVNPVASGAAQPQRLAKPQTAATRTAQLPAQGRTISGRSYRSR